MLCPSRLTLVVCGLDGSAAVVAADAADDDAAVRAVVRDRGADIEGIVAAAVTTATVASRGPKRRGVLGHSTI